MLSFYSAPRNNRLHANQTTGTKYRQQQNNTKRSKARPRKKNISGGSEIDGGQSGKLSNQRSPRINRPTYDWDKREGSHGFNR